MNKAKFNSYYDVLEMPGMETQHILYRYMYLFRNIVVWNTYNIKLFVQILNTVEGNTCTYK